MGAPYNLSFMGGVIAIYFIRTTKERISTPALRHNRKKTVRVIFSPNQESPPSTDIRDIKELKLIFVWFIRWRMTRKLKETRQ